MPIHIHPVMRGRELAEENASLIVALNSDGLNVQRNAESAGIAPVAIPVGRTTIFVGNSYDPAANKSKW